MYLCMYVCMYVCIYVYICSCRCVIREKLSSLVLQPSFNSPPVAKDLGCYKAALRCLERAAGLEASPAPVS